MMAHDFPPWPAAHQQIQRWLRAGCVEAMVHNLRILLREYTDRNGQSGATILDSRTLQPTPKSGACAGDDGAKRRKGAKVHAAVDTSGHLLALHVTPADKQGRAQLEQLAQAMQELRAIAWSWQMRIRDITARTQNRRRRHTVLNEPWSNTG
jgi:transposase